MLDKESFNVSVNSRINDILESDKINFNISSKNAMINSIIFYYFKFEIKKIEEEIKEKLKSKLGKIKTKLETENIIELMRDLRKIDAKKEKDTSKLNFRLNKKTYDEYYKYILDLEEEKINITKLFREIFEWYCSKKQYEREQIVCQDLIKIIKEQLQPVKKEKRSLKLEIKTLKNKEVEVIPLGIVISKNENYSYLLGYTELVDRNTFEKIGKFDILPTRISNIQKITAGKVFKIVRDKNIEESFYSVKSNIIDKANEMMENRVVSYGDESEVKLALTEKGNEMLGIILHNRPFRLDKVNKEEVIKDSGEKTYIYTFNSTHFAVKTYFLAFGKECTILAPEKLKQDFKNHYINAFNNYK